MLLPLLATALALGSLFVSKVGARYPLWAQLLARAVLFAALTVLVQAILTSPVQPRYDPVGSSLRFWQQLIEASWWWVGARTAIAFARLLVVLENRPRESRIVSDLLAGAITVASALAVINFAFDVPIGGLLATSGVIAIVLGLALQSSLSDVFSGIAVGLERPYKPGDNLWVEGGIEGNVVQVSWRSTQIATFDDNVAIVPNSVIAKSRLINRSSPTPRRSSTATIALEPAARPDFCLEVLSAAALSCRQILPDPAPAVSCKELRGEGSRWDIRFTVAASRDLPAARTELLTAVHHHLRHAGIALAVDAAATPAPASVPTLEDLLESSDLFGAVAAGERAALAPHFAPVQWRAGDTLIREGDAAEALFVIATGVADVTVGTRSVHRLIPGETLGAISLVLRAQYASTVTALTELRAYRLGKDDIAAATEAHPEIAAALDGLARRGQNALRANATAGQAEDVHPEMSLSRLRSLLRVLAK